MVSKIYSEDEIMNNIDETNQYNQSKLIINLICSCLSLILGLIYYLMRFGLDNNPISTVLNTLGISFFIIFSPYLLKKIISSSKININNTFLKCDAFIQFLNIGLLVCTAFLFKSVSLTIYLVFVILGFVGFIGSIFDYFKIYKNKIFTLINFILIAVFSLITVHIIWNSNLNLLHPLFFEKILVDSPHIDTLFHITIANFINTLNMVTVGLDGTNVLPYHAGSHFILAQLAQFIKVSVLVFYQISYALVFIPLFLSSLLGVAVDFKLNNYKNRDLILKWWHYLFLFIAITGTLPVLSINGFKVEDIIGIASKLNPFPLSESYLISLIFLFLLVSITLYITNKYKTNTIPKSSINLFLFLIAPLLFLTIGLCKISTLALIVPVVFYVLVRFKLWNKEYLIFSFLTLFILASLYKITSSTEYMSSHFELFSFFKHYVLVQYNPNKVWPPALFIAYTLALNFWTILFGYTRIKQENITSLKDFIESKNLVDVELLVLIAILGFILPELNVARLGDVGANGYYFNTLQFFIAVPLFIGAFNSNLNEGLFKSPLKNKKIVCIFILAITIACTNLVYKLAGFLNKLDYLRHIRHSIQQVKNEPNIKYKALMELNNINKTLPLKQKKSTALFIPTTNKAIWGSFEDDTRKIPFVATASSGLPLIKGVKKDIIDAVCKKTPQFCEYDKTQVYKYDFYGYPQYNPTSGEPNYHSKAQFCIEVSGYPFSDYIVVDQASDKIITTKISCKY